MYNSVVGLFTSFSFVQQEQKNFFKKELIFSDFWARWGRKYFKYFGGFQLFMGAVTGCAPEKSASEKENKQNAAKTF